MPAVVIREALRRTWAGALVAVLLLPSACRAAPVAESGLQPPPGPAGVHVEATAAPDTGSAPPVIAETAPPRLAGRISRLPDSLRREMRGTTWKPGCPVPLTDLRLLRFNYWGFDGVVGRGPMVVQEDVAEDVLWVFGRLFRTRFPIKQVALAREFVPEEFEPRISSARSVTASFNCRPVVTPLGPGDEYSQHAFGLAVDINPVQNPFVTADGFVRNRKARPYLDRSRRLEGMIHDGDVVVRSFAAIGWKWGGHWSGGKDYMHFSLLGS
jgi:D-alanyl-D-alanine carboxypeptidase-like protein